MASFAGLPPHVAVPCCSAPFDRDIQVLQTIEHGEPMCRRATLRVGPSRDRHPMVDGSSAPS